jgi:hypothetical protein
VIDDGERDATGGGETDATGKGKRGMNRVLGRDSVLGGRVGEAAFAPEGM